MRHLGSALLAVFVPLGIGIASAHQNTQFSENCATCHTQGTVVGESHFIKSSKDCTFCHEVRGVAGVHDVTTRSDNMTCPSCHVEQNGTEQDTGHRQLRCTRCHNPHGSAHMYMLAQPTVTLCTERCHTKSDIGLSHPVGAGVIDRTSGREMTCTSTCHSMHHPREPKLLQLADNDLCQRCHAEKF